MKRYTYKKNIKKGKKAKGGDGDSSSGNQSNNPFMNTPTTEGTIPPVGDNSNTNIIPTNTSNNTTENVQPVTSTSSTWYNPMSWFSSKKSESVGGSKKKTRKTKRLKRKLKK
jgi:hypothetical protein